MQQNIRLQNKKRPDEIKNVRPGEIMLHYKIGKDRDYWLRFDDHARRKAKFYSSNGFLYRVERADSGVVVVLAQNR